MKKERKLDLALFYAAMFIFYKVTLAMVLLIIQVVNLINLSHFKIVSTLQLFLSDMIFTQKFHYNQIFKNFNQINSKGS